MQLPFALETPLERRICADPVWQAGAVWGKPRPGHGEGSVVNHVAQVLANVERHATTPTERRALRLVALIHDNFKYQVRPEQPRVGENHHAMLARHFAGRYLDRHADAAILDVIELHDEAYHCWRLGHHTGDWTRAEARATRLLERLGASWPLYLRFFRCDNDTPYKEQAPVHWFERFLRARGLTVPDPPPAPQSDPAAPASGD
jgi:hypothetical protein